jgi:hypothetical protein
MLNSITKIRLIGISVAILIAAILVFVIALSYLEYVQKKEISLIDQGLKLKVPKEKVISYVRAIDPETQTEIIAYIYITDKVVVSDTYQGYKEDIRKRSNNSRAYKKPSDDPEIENYVAKFYSGYPFQLDEGVWKETSNATTTATAFLLQTENTPLDEIRGLLGQPVFAADETVDPGTGDGYIYSLGFSSWDETHDTTIGAAANYTSQGLIASANEFAAPDWSIARSFLPFNTSGLSDVLSISDAVLYLKFFGQTNNIDDPNDFITIVEGTPASNTSLIIEDFDQVGAVDSPIEGVDRLSTTDLLINAVYYALPLNATGRSWISTTGYTSFGIREGHDVEDAPNGTVNSLTIHGADTLSSNSAPYLEITYSVIAPITAPTNVKIDSGEVKVNNGTLKID